MLIRNNYHINQKHTFRVNPISKSQKIQNDQTHKNKQIKKESKKYHLFDAYA